MTAFPPPRGLWNHVWLNQPLEEYTPTWSDKGSIDYSVRFQLHTRNYLSILHFFGGDQDLDPGVDIFDDAPYSYYLGVLPNGTYPSRYIALETDDGRCGDVVNVQTELAGAFSAGTWIPGRFEESFFDLDQLTRGFDDLDFTHTRALLQAGERTSPEAIEALGLKLPAITASKWGPIIILGLQLYILLILAEQRRPPQTSDPNDGFEWIGIYRSIWAELSVILTIGLLPVITVIVFSYEGWDDIMITSAIHMRTFELYPVRVMLVCYSLISAVVASGSLRKIKDMRRLFQ